MQRSFARTARAIAAGALALSLGVAGVALASSNGGSHLPPSGRVGSARQVASSAPR